MFDRGDKVDVTLLIIVVVVVLVVLVFNNLSKPKISIAFVIGYSWRVSLPVFERRNQEVQIMIASFELQLSAMPLIHCLPYMQE